MTGMVLGSAASAAAQALAARLSGTAPSTAATPNSSEESVSSPDPFINRFSPEGYRVALTFDDGPTPAVTERILDELKRRHVLATFFMIGQRVAAQPDLARRVASEGHEIGNHTFTHPKLNTLPDQQVALELDQTQDVIQEVVNQRPVSFRPPYLAFRKNQAVLAHSKGLKIICGDVDSRDWSQPGEEKIIATIFTKTSPGSIIICHDCHDQTANCLGQILDGLLERGCKFGTISSFLVQTETIS
jgi:peptidoglycan/xylan/chitin deacetylase (PgdA/CDA1 family)